MKIKVGEEIAIGGKKRMIVEIQRDLFNGADDVVSFDDKTKLPITKVKEDEVYLKLVDYPYNHNFDHIYNHACPEGMDVSHWIYNKLRERGWKSVVNLKHIYLDGMIPKKDLVIGATYQGYCRNASEAVWNGKKFMYMREKFGSRFEEDIEHPEDDCGYDVFVPTLNLSDLKCGYCGEMPN